MNAKYRRVGSRKWEDVIVLEFYDELGYFLLRWNDLLQEFDEVLVRPERVRETQ